MAGRTMVGWEWVQMSFCVKKYALVMSVKKNTDQSGLMRQTREDRWRMVSIYMVNDKESVGLKIYMSLNTEGSSRSWSLKKAKSKGPSLPLMGLEVLPGS